MTAYWIARVKVSDPEAYGEYVKRVPAAVEAFGDRFLARGGRVECLEGEAFPRNVVIEFPDFEAAVACYNSPAYQEAKAFAEGAAERDIIILDGS